MGGGVISIRHCLPSNSLRNLTLILENIGPKKVLASSEHNTIFLKIKENYNLIQETLGNTKQELLAPPETRVLNFSYSISIKLIEPSN